MKHYESIKSIFISQDGIAKTADITSKGIHNRYLSRLLKIGKISRIKRGLYEWIENGPKDDLEVLFSVLPETILCMHSALFYHDYTDRTPDVWHIAVDKNINKKKLKLNYPPLQIYYVTNNFLKIGVVKGTLNQINVNVYNKERTICDVVRYSSKIDNEILNKAIQNYVNDNRKNINRLIEYSKIFNISKKIYRLIGVWI